MKHELGTVADISKPFAEMFIDETGQVVFKLYIEDDYKFEEIKEAMWDFITMLQDQIRNGKFKQYSSGNYNDVYKGPGEFHTRPPTE